MMYKCCECGHLFEDGEQAVWEERHGFDHGPFEKWDGCPLCKGGYNEVFQCKECGDWHENEDLNNGLCEKCINKIVDRFRYSPEKCYKISRSNKSKEEISIDRFLSYMFTESQINEILYRELTIAAKLIKINCSSFVDNDKEWFIESIIEEVK